MTVTPQNIITKNDLANFVKTLSQEARSPSKGWENDDLPSFLEAMAAWIEDMDGYYENRREQSLRQPSWQTIGEILKAATLYE